MCFFQSMHCLTSWYHPLPPYICVSSSPCIVSLPGITHYHLIIYVFLPVQALSHFLVSPTTALYICVSSSPCIVSRKTSWYRPRWRCTSCRKFLHNYRRSILCLWNCQEVTRWLASLLGRARVIVSPELFDDLSNHLTDTDYRLCMLNAYIYIYI